MRGGRSADRASVRDRAARHPLGRLDDLGRLTRLGDATDGRDEPVARGADRLGERHLVAGADGMVTPVTSPPLEMSNTSAPASAAHPATVVVCSTSQPPST